MKIKEEKLIYWKKFRKREIEIKNIIWAYLQCEDVKASMC